MPASHAATLDQKSPYLKAHLRTGYVYVLSSWEVDSAGTVVTGHGSLLDPNRAVVSQGEFQLPVDSVALFETNSLYRGGTVAALAIMTGVTAAITGYCITDPKACYGSCPTFYLADSSGPLLVAEGFSGSIAPALEAVDLDALYPAVSTSRDFRLQLRNEALETHVVRYADLLALRHPRGARVFLTPAGAFRPVTQLRRPASCTDAGGDCLQLVSDFDGRERTSLADSVDLATREVIDLQFDSVPSGDIGLVITSRQSLMSTYLFYQTLAYFGTQAPAAIAALGSGGPVATEQAKGLGNLLGKIEVLLPDSAEGWVPVGSTGETGPLASDTKVVPLPRGDDPPHRLRLRLTRGHWRIDYIALASLGKQLQPARIPPSRVEREGRSDPAAWRALVDTSKSLVTFAGDAYDLIYRLPARPEQYELFLESRGYYLEWMRREWLAEENLASAAEILLDPAGALRRLAPAFKRREPAMEKLFWESRFVRR